jgi:PAS domain-containing protein
MGVEHAEIVAVAEHFEEWTVLYNHVAEVAATAGFAEYLIVAVVPYLNPVMRREMELANGMWIMVNENALPDGGRVSVYSDITVLKRREYEAAAARQQFEDAIESISTGFAMFDPEDRLQVWNSRFRDYFADVADTVVSGASFRDMLAASISRGVFPAAESNPAAFLDATLAKRAKGDGQVRENRLSNGQWLQISDHRTRDCGLASIYTDVTELKTREQEAQAARERFEVAIEAISTGFALWDAEDRMVVCNSRYRNYFPEMPDKVVPGATFTEIMSTAIKRGLFPGSALDPKDHLAKALDARARASGAPREQHLASGTWLQITDHRTNGGGLVSIYADVTELKQREAELEAALKEFNVVVETINYGVLIVGPDLLCRLWNRAFLEYWDLPVELLEGRPSLREVIEYNRESGLYDVSPDKWDDWLDNRIATVSAGAIPPTEVVRADGSVMSYQCVALPDGGRMLTYFDITELKKREAEISQARDAAEAALEDLRKAQERLVQAEKMASLGQLTAGIAHEIKNPLNFVNNFARLSDELLGELAEVLEGPIAALDEEARDDAEDLLGTVRGNLVKINEHGRRADSIVKNMLLHSREGPSEKQSIALNGVAAEALNLAYHGARAENPNFNIEMKTDFSECSST